MCTSDGTSDYRRKKKIFGDMGGICVAVDYVWSYPLGKSVLGAVALLHPGIDALEMMSGDVVLQRGADHQRRGASAAVAAGLSQETNANIGLSPETRLASTQDPAHGQGASLSLSEQPHRAHRPSAIIRSVIVHITSCIVIRPLLQFCLSAYTFRSQLAETEHHQNPDYLPANPPTSSKHDDMSELAAGGRRRKMGSHRKSHGHQKYEDQSAREDRMKDAQQGRDVGSLTDERGIKTREEHGEEPSGMDRISEVDESDKKSPNISISNKTEHSRPLRARDEAESVQKEKPHWLGKMEHRQLKQILAPILFRIYPMFECFYRPPGR
ncbi:putative ras and EF-hand domain-containing protein -like [Scophthalmus maximus]|uniref:Putative ras and EF-hand domain-containing protein-like n=1 Tax=Scophthalmus maximus TaxID=52904 RepID=A0A2U9BGN1_SCOMX|nr:putative ras and EF-hand domain-containing protein -like [Scophthalmus maximus]